MALEIPAAAGQLWDMRGELFELLEERERAEQCVREIRTALRGSWQPVNKDNPDVVKAIADLDKVIDNQPQLLQAQAELDAINAGISKYVATKLQAVDEVRAPLLAIREGVELNKRDAAAATGRAIELQRRYDKLEDMIKLAMQVMAENGFWKPGKTKKLESARGAFTLSGNGGVQPVEITDETLVPIDYCRVTVTMPARMWPALLDLAKEVAGMNGGMPDLQADLETIRFTRQVSSSAVAAALAKSCESCGGIGEWTQNNSTTGGTGEKVTCESCGGTGKHGVPGARLAERGQHLRVK